jgi:uncharacterized protein YjhX (UPF0386 family)
MRLRGAKVLWNHVSLVATQCDYRTEERWLPNAARICQEYKDQMRVIALECVDDSTWEFVDSSMAILRDASSKEEVDRSGEVEHPAGASPCKCYYCYY